MSFSAWCFVSGKDYDDAIGRVDRIIAALETAPQKAAQEWLDKDFLPVARQLVPYRTGELHDSIGGRVTGSSIEVFATADHARFVEEGTSKSPAQPFMGPAWHKTIGKLRTRIAQALRKASK